MSQEKKKRLKKKKAKPNYIWRIFKQYLINSSLHGVGYIVGDNRHWSESTKNLFVKKSWSSDGNYSKWVQEKEKYIERLFWSIACISSWCGCGILIAASINDFTSHKLDITMDTNYLNWEIDFPALHFCFYFGGAAKEYSVNITGVNPRKSSVMIRLTNWGKMGYDASIMGNISSKQFLMWRKYIQPECADLFGQCIWNDEYVDCCQMFSPLETNLGQCLSFNSVYAKTSENANLPKFVMNHRKQKATMTLYLNKTAFWNTARDHFFLLLTNGNEFPSRSLGKDSYLTLQWNKPSATVWDIVTIPTHNDEGVMSMTYRERRCRFMSEIDGFRYLSSYSYHGCVMESQMRLSDSLCGCIGHLFPPSDKYQTCNSTQLYCASQNTQKIIETTGSDCLPNCEETKIYWFDNLMPNEHDIPNWAVTKLMFNLLPGPYTRYNRYTAHSLLDVIISIGGTLGLFSGASVLSFVELLYWLLLRHADAE